MKLCEIDVPKGGGCDDITIRSDVDGVVHDKELCSRMYLRHQAPSITLMWILLRWCWVPRRMFHLLAVLAVCLQAILFADRPFLLTGSAEHNFPSTS